MAAQFNPGHIRHVVSAADKCKISSLDQFKRRCAMIDKVGLQPGIGKELADNLLKQWRVVNNKNIQDSSLKEVTQSAYDPVANNPACSIHPINVPDVTIYDAAVAQDLAWIMKITSDIS